MKIGKVGEEDIIIDVNKVLLLYLLIKIFGALLLFAVYMILVLFLSL